MLQWPAGGRSFSIARVAKPSAASVGGLLVSYYANVPTGPAVILGCGAFYLLSMLVGVRGGVLWGLMPRKHLEA